MEVLYNLMGAIATGVVFVFSMALAGILLGHIGEHPLSAGAMFLIGFISYLLFLKK